MFVYLQNSTKHIVSDKSKFTIFCCIVASNQTLAIRFIPPIAIMNARLFFYQYGLLKFNI